MYTDPEREEHGGERVSGSGLVGLGQEDEEMSQLLDEIQDNASSAPKFSVLWKELNKHLDERAMEIETEKKRVTERLKEIEAKEIEIALKQEEWIEKKRKEAEDVKKSLMNLVDKEEEIRSRDKTITEKEKKLQEIVKEIELKQRELEEREIELKEKANEVKRKDEILEAKARELEWKRKCLDLQQIEIERRPTMQGGETSNRSRVKYLAEKSSEAADSSIRPLKSHSPRPLMIQDDEGEVGERVEEEESEPEAIKCPDSEFHDFNKTINCFKVGQVWALYDPVDDMPRVYGRITKIVKSRSSLHVRWVDPRDEEKEASVGPVACGRFEFGMTETQGLSMFSHEMHRVIQGQYLIKMYPQKGETWSMFRDWSKNPEQHKPPYRYDFVEILFNFDDHQGLVVADLRKVEGYVSVFTRAEQNRFVIRVISPAEMHRFSHRVPSFRLSGEEKQGVPAGSFELDPAAVPASVLQPDQSFRGEATETACGSRNVDPVIILD